MVGGWRVSLLTVRCDVQVWECSRKLVKSCPESFERKAVGNEAPRTSLGDPFIGIGTCFFNRPRMTKPDGRCAREVNGRDAEALSYGSSHEGIHENAREYGIVARSGMLANERGCIGRGPCG